MNAAEIPAARELTACEFLSLLPVGAEPFIPEVDDSNDEPEHGRCDGCESCELGAQLADERTAHQQLRDLCKRLAAAWGGWHGADLLHILKHGTMPARYDNPGRRCPNQNCGRTFEDCRCTDGAQSLDAYRGTTDEQHADILDHLHRRRAAAADQRPEADRERNLGRSADERLGQRLADAAAAVDAEIQRRLTEEDPGAEKDLSWWQR